MLVVRRSWRLKRLSRLESNDTMTLFTPGFTTGFVSQSESYNRTNTCEIQHSGLGMSSYAQLLLWLWFISTGAQVIVLPCVWGSGKANSAMTDSCLLHTAPFTCVSPKDSSASRSLTDHCSSPSAVVKHVTVAAFTAFANKTLTTSLDFCGLKQKAQVGLFEMKRQENRSCEVRRPLTLRRPYISLFTTPRVCFA